MNKTQILTCTPLRTKWNSFSTNVKIQLSFGNSLTTPKHITATWVKLEITVCHFPPGTSKWNKIEHRLFSYISLNWKGQPLVDYETVVQLIGAVKTKTGLKVKSQLDINIYEKGKKVSDEELESINLYKHEFHGEWNYTIKPI